MMSNQSADLLNAHNKNNCKPHKTLKARPKSSNKNIEKQSAIFTNNLDGHVSIDTATANGFELFTRFAYCQALLYKAWVEASDELANKVTKSANESLNNSKDLTSLYIDTFEEKFTDLFRSPAFAANLAKLLNSLIESIKDKNNIAELFLNSLPRMQKKSEGCKSSKSDLSQKGRGD